MRNLENLDPEIGTPTKSFADREITPFRSFRYRKLEESRLLIIKSPRIAKCETPKSRKEEDSFRYRELEESRLFIIRSPGIVKCETTKT